MPLCSVVAEPRLVGKNLSLVLILMGLTACVAEMPPPPASDSFLVEQVRLTHHVPFTDDGRALGIAERHDLAAFLDAADPDRRGTLYLDARGTATSSRIGTVAAALADLGRVHVGTGDGDVPAHGVTVTLVQDIILPEACLHGDDWPAPHLRPGSCSQALTLVQMVEDPSDLLRGREMGPALSVTAARAAARHLERSGPAPVEKRSARTEPEKIPTVPPASLTRETGY